jgi:hypothetical protein
MKIFQSINLCRKQFEWHWLILKPAVIVEDGESRTNSRVIRPLTNEFIELSPRMETQCFLLICKENWPRLVFEHREPQTSLRVSGCYCYAVSCNVSLSDSQKWRQSNSIEVEFTSLRQRIRTRNCASLQNWKPNRIIKPMM